MGTELLWAMNHNSWHVHRHRARQNKSQGVLAHWVLLPYHPTESVIFSLGVASGWWPSPHSMLSYPFAAR